MATAPEDNSASHQRGGRSIGGKIRKTAYRNTQATPYDRPLTALRNSNNSVGNTNGWLSRLVDPASKIISCGARKILSSVFSKGNLAATVPKQNVFDGVLKLTNMQQDVSSMVIPMTDQNKESVAQGEPAFDTDQVAELERMLKQKRFTRYEVDRLTNLLRSRTVSSSNRREQGNPSKNTSEHVVKNHVQTPHKDIIPIYRRNGSTPTPTRHKVFDEDVTSPLEIAKAYMSSRASKFSPPASDSRGLALVSWTPNMQHSASLKGSELRKFAYGEPSSFAYELSASQSRLSGFKNASLKRRSSVLQDQYGSIGPIRRVRQKLNLISSKRAEAQVCESTPHNSESTDKTLAIADTPSSNVDTAPTHVNATAQHTAPLSQLIHLKNKAIANENLGGSADKSLPLSTSGWQTPVGPNFRNLEKGESSGAIQDPQPDYSRDASLSDAGYSAMKDSMASKNEQSNLNNFATEKISDSKILKNTHLADEMYCDKRNSTLEPSPKKQAFHMSVLEDFIDMDEDDAANEVPSVVLPSGSSTMGVIVGPETSDEPVVSKKSVSIIDAVCAPNISSKPPIPNGESNLSTETSLEGQNDASGYSLKTPDRNSPLMVGYSPIVACSSGEPNPPTSSDTKAEAARFESGPHSVNGTPKQNEINFVNIYPEARHTSSKPEIVIVPGAPVLETSSVFSLEDAANHKGSPSNCSSVSSLHSTVLNSDFILDTKQDNSPSANPNGNSNGPGSSIGVFPTLSSYQHTSASSDYGAELVNVKVSPDGSQIFPSTLSSIPITSSSGAANNTAASFGSFMTPTQNLTAETSTEMAPIFKSSGGASSTAPAFPSVVVSFTSASSGNATTNFVSGAPITTASGTGFTFGAATIPGQTTAATTNSGSVTGAETTPVIFGVAAISGPTKSASTNAGFMFGGSLTPSSVASTAGFSFGASSTSAFTSSGISAGTFSTPATTSTEFSFGASSTPTLSSGFPIGGSSATASIGFSFGASSSSTTSSGFPTRGVSTPAITSNGFTIGGSSTPATTSGLLSFGSSAAPATTSSQFSFGGSSAPATTSSQFSFGGSSAPATTSSGFSIGGSSAPAVGSIMSSSPAGTTSVSGFSFGASSTTGATAVCSAFPAAPSGAASSSFIFGASSTPMTSTAGFLSGPSSTFGATPNPFSFGAASTPSTSTANNGSPFGFTSGSSAFPFSAVGTNNVSAGQPVFGNTNPFGSTTVNNNNQNIMEDSMAEDPVQATAPAFPAFGSQQTANANFGFGAPNPSVASNSFQFASQTNLSNPSPFQSSGSLGGFNAGGSFSLGSTGDKSNRRIIKPKKTARRKQ